jgi:hypothetical protein
MVRVEGVIVVERRNPTSSGECHAKVARRDTCDMPEVTRISRIGSPVGEVAVGDSWVVKVSEPPSRVLRRTVADDDDLDVLVALGKG